MSTPFEQARAALYVAAPSEFVARRKELSAKLKAGGDPAGAKLLAASPKPSAHAWVVNRLFEDGALDAAFAAGTESRAAQAALMRGESDPPTAKRAQEAHKAAIAAAVARAQVILEGSEVATTPTLLSKVSGLALAITLRGSFAPYASGCLAGDVELPSLEELASGLVVAPGVALGGGARVLEVVVAPAVVVASDDTVDAAVAAAEAERRREAARAEALAEATRVWEVAVGAARAAREALASAAAERGVAEAALEAARAAVRAAEDRVAVHDAAVGVAERAVAACERDVDAAALARASLVGG